MIRHLACVRGKSAQISLPSCKDDDVCLERRPVRKLEPVLSEARNSAPGLNLDVPIDDVFARAVVCLKCVSAGVQRGASTTGNRHRKRFTKVVSSRAREEKLDEACSIWPKICLEPCFSEPIQEIPRFESKHVKKTSHLRDLTHLSMVCAKWGTMRW